MKEQFRIYDGGAESQKAKAQAKSLNGFHTTPPQRKKQPCAWMM